MLTQQKSGIQKTCIPGLSWQFMLSNYWFYGHLYVCFVFLCDKAAYTEYPPMANDGFPPPEPPFADVISFAIFPACLPLAMADSEQQTTI